MTGGPLPEEMTDEQFFRLYGPWQPATLDEVRGWLAGWDRPWWIAGGRSIEAYTGVVREHEDVDVAFFRRDVASLHALLSPRFDLWAAGSGTLKPLGWDHGRRVAPVLPEWSGQVWLREHALAPWQIDFVATPDEDGRWVFKRDPSCIADLDEVTWVDADGVRYQRPEVTLAFKAHLMRPKDEADLAAALPALSPSEAGWLRDRLRALHPDGHAWDEQVAARAG